MIRIRTAAVASAAALVGVAVLAGCSSSSDSTASASTAASTAASAAASEGSTEMLPPVIITADQTEATCAVGNALDIVVDEKKMAGTTVSSSDESIVTVTQAKQEGDALFNPGGQCVAAGAATITVTNPDSSTRDIAITVTQ